MLTFESQIKVIDLAIAQHAKNWTLKARPDIDFDDVAQLIRIHINKKFSQWDQTRNLVPWLHRIIRNQIINILRNVYSGMSRPCLKCSASLDGDMCSLFIKQCSKCPLFAKWEKTKKKKSDVHLPVSLEHHANTMMSMPNVDINFDKAIPLLNQRLKKVLKPTEWQFYDLMYIQNKKESDVVKIMDFKSTEKKASHRYKRMLQIQKSVMDKAREILKEQGLEN